MDVGNDNTVQHGGGDSSEKAANLVHYDDDVVTTVPAPWIEETLCQYRGFWFFNNSPSFNVRDVIYVQQHFKARPSDVLLSTEPKSGTTWLKSIAFAIMHRNTFPIHSTTHPLLTTNPHQCVPYIESAFRSQEQHPTCSGEHHTPRLLATHIPYSVLPQSVVTNNCRIVHLHRDPKDMFVSLFHFMSKVRSKDLPPFSLEEGFYLYLQGVSPYGPFWDHSLEYYEASLARPDSVLLVSYEDMQKDAASQVKRLACFLGLPFSLEEESNGLVEAIVQLCSFDNQRNLDVNKNKECAPGIPPNNAFYRQGKVGDSKNHMTTEMIERFDQVAREKLGDLFAYFMNM